MLKYLLLINNVEISQRFSHERIATIINRYCQNTRYSRNFSCKASWCQRLDPSSFRQVIESYKRADPPSEICHFEPELIPWLVTSWSNNTVPSQDSLAAQNFFSSFSRSSDVVICISITCVSVHTEQHDFCLFITVHTSRRIVHQGRLSSYPDVGNILMIYRR